MAELAFPLPRPVGLRPARVCTDAQLVQRAAGGDRRAFAEIFQRHHQAVYRYCRSIVGNGEDAADALQNTMAAVLRALEGETREIELKAWIFRIAHNEAISLLRRRRGQSELEESVPCPRSSVESDVLESERLGQLVADVRALPERQRGALVMRELSGLDYAQIAAAFGVTEGAARQAVHEARTMLHELGEGRAMPCPDVRELIGARDGRLLRGRKVRAHLRACGSCAAFRAAIGQRRAGLSAAAPPLAPAAAASMLNGLLGGGHGGATAIASGAGAASAGSTGLVPGSAAVTGLAAKAAATGAITAKATAVVAATATLAGGAVIAHHQITPSQQPATSLSAPPAANGQPGMAAPGLTRSDRGPQVAPGGAVPSALDGVADRTKSQPASRRRDAEELTPPSSAPRTTPTPRRRPSATQRPNPGQQPAARRPSGPSTPTPPSAPGAPATAPRAQTPALERSPTPVPPASARPSIPTAPALPSAPRAPAPAPRPD